MRAGCGLPENNLQGLAFSESTRVIGVLEYFDEGMERRGALSGTKWMRKSAKGRLTKY